MQHKHTALKEKEESCDLKQNIYPQLIGLEQQQDVVKNWTLEETERRVEPM